MAIKLNEITNFTHKKAAMLSGADLPLLVSGFDTYGVDVTLAVFQCQDKI